MKKPKQDHIPSEELAALIRRAETRSLQEGDYGIITTIFEKTFALSQMVRENKIPAKRQLKRFLAIPRPERSDE